MKAKYQIYKVTLHSGEIYIGQHKGDVLTDGYIGSPSGKFGCNSYSLIEIARIEVIDYSNTQKEIDRLEKYYVDYYRKTFGVSKRVLDIYPFLSRMYEEGVCLNVCFGGRDVFLPGADFSSDNGYIVQCTKDWEYIRTFDTMEEVKKEVNAKYTSNIMRCIRKRHGSAYGYKWLAIKKEQFSILDDIIAEYKEYDENRTKKLEEERGVAINQYSKDGKFIKTFISLREAGDSLGINDLSSLRDCLRGIFETAYGFKWQYVNPQKNVANSCSENRCKKVAQYSKEGKLIKIFESLNQAARELGLKDSHGISACCKGKQLTCAGYKWEYVIDTDSSNLNYSVPIKVKQFDKYHNFIREYSSIGEASRMTKAHTYDISKACKGIRKLVNGYIWEYSDENLAKQYIRKEFLNRRPVRALNSDGDIIYEFASSIEAATYLKIAGCYGIIKCCKKKSKMAYGYIWEFADEESSYIPRPKTNIRINQYDLDNNFIKTFYSLEDICKSVQKGIKAITERVLKCCQGKSTRAFGYKWRYSDQELAKLYSNTKPTLSNCIPVDQYDMSGNYLTTFSSLAEAARSVGCLAHGGSVRLCCIGELHRYKGYVWRFHVENPPSHIEVTKHKKQPNCKKVSQYDKQGNYIATYKSIAEAARLTNISDSCIRDCVNHRQKTAGKCKWEFAA